MLSRLKKYFTDVHTESLQKKLLAYEIFTGMPNWKLKHEDSITHYTRELLDTRDRNIDLMNELRAWKKKAEDLEAKMNDTKFTAICTAVLKGDRCAINGVSITHEQYDILHALLWVAAARGKISSASAQLFDEEVLQTRLEKLPEKKI